MEQATIAASPAYKSIPYEHPHWLVGRFSSNVVPEGRARHLDLLILRFCRADLGWVLYVGLAEFWENWTQNFSANSSANFHAIFQPRFSGASGPPKKIILENSCPNILAFRFQIFEPKYISPRFSASGADHHPGATGRRRKGIGKKVTENVQKATKKVTKKKVTEAEESDLSSRARKPWSVNCELKHWNFRGWKCLIHGLHFTV